MLIFRNHVFDASIPDWINRVLVNWLALEWIIEEVFSMVIVPKIGTSLIHFFLVNIS